MKTQMLWKFMALALTLSVPAFAVDGRNKGNFQRKEIKSAEEIEQAQDDRGFALGLRAGYAIPLGSRADATRRGGEKLSNWLTGAIPLQVDAGYFFNSNVYLGAYFQYAHILRTRDCPRCSDSKMRFGVNVSYHFRAGETFMPWLGLGIGYEILSSEITVATGTSLETSFRDDYRGIEFASVQAGADYRINDSFSIGPYVSLAAGVYQTKTSSVDFNVPGKEELNSESSKSIEHKAVHAWLSGGLRMQFRF
ncbi:outer membrane beta-barrel protein [Myxococcus xanthus]|uniref:Outer membrane beta-barrel protein n=1 Tax=Myxococcus xanthus TaxID=34 RepID=A0A7Y4MTT7_MYXXA|nr:outer membrane beta-barrel protein [Myxococcus xanthus]NOJ81915.1 outer membrane beta-barrel protein [Myxococcus xanthus]NOJ89339.1 outer membrane beta-barrel protein [Myxococcus xanthus]